MPSFIINRIKDKPEYPCEQISKCGEGMPSSELQCVMLCGRVVKVCMEHRWPQQGPSSQHMHDYALFGGIRACFYRKDFGPWYIRPCVASYLRSVMASKVPTSTQPRRPIAMHKHAACGTPALIIAMNDRLDIFLSALINAKPRQHHFHAWPMHANTQMFMDFNKAHRLLQSINYMISCSVKSMKPSAYDLADAPTSKHQNLLF
jgi:hypothetical protein